MATAWVSSSAAETLSRLGLVVLLSQSCQPVSQAGRQARPLDVCADGTVLFLHMFRPKMPF
jgi:hypothetical protein